MNDYKNNLFGGFVIIAFFVLSYFFITWGEYGDSGGVSSGDLEKLVTTSPNIDGENSGARDMVLGKLMDINSITANELKLIPGVGEKTAKKIFDKRTELGQFKTLDDLFMVGGLGKKKIETIKKYVEVREQLSFK